MKRTDVPGSHFVFERSRGLKTIEPQHNNWCRGLGSLSVSA